MFHPHPPLPNPSPNASPDPSPDPSPKSSPNPSPNPSPSPGEALAEVPFASSWLVDDAYCLPATYVALDLNATLVVPGPDSQSYWEVAIADTRFNLRWGEPPGGWSKRVTHENVDEWLENPDLSSFDRWTCLPSGRMYAAAIYWSVMSITSIGYGDIAATPRNHYEMYWASFLMLLCGVCWSQVLATMTQVF